MEDIVYKAAKAYLEANTLPISSKGLDVPKLNAWWEEQMKDVISDKDNEAFPFPVPAIFYQFTPTKYATENNGRVKATGEMILHVVQSRIGIDGRSGSESETSWNLKLQMVGTLIGIFHGTKLSCAARLTLMGTERDSTNNPLMHETITFSWTATKKTSAF